MLRSSILASLLALTLLFAQQGMATHGIAHALEEQSQDRSLPHDQQCELCAAYAQIGGALGSSAVRFEFGATCTGFIPALTVSRVALVHAAFAARAPPHHA